MTTEAESPGPATHAASARRSRGRTRPPSEVVRDLERERAELVHAVDRLKLQASTTKDRLLSPGALLRPVAIAGGVLIAILLLRGLFRSLGRAGRHA